MYRRIGQEQRVQLRQPGGARPDAPLVLFVCTHNAGRSRMAEAFLDHLADGRFRALSAGTEPARKPHPEVVAAMADAGLEIEQRPGRLLTPELAESAIKLVAMGCNVEEACPALTTPMEDWGLPDPKGKPPEEVARIRDDIEIRVRNLIAQMMRDEL